MKKINLLIAGALTLELAACGTEKTEAKTQKNEIRRSESATT
ncbi:ABC transporter substrate-binding protein [Bacillus cereus]|nr:ABC transporter substrate-binding protein [Bacillus cereus]WAI12304.1 ABC transporter substrate-binding protein [Bacillus cereus]